MRGKPPDVDEHFSELRLVHEDIPPPVHHHQPGYHPPTVRHRDTTIATPAQVPSNSADGGSSAQSSARLNWTTSNASQHKSLSDQKTPGALLTPPQLEVFHHTTDKATPPSVLSEPSLSTESSCMLRGLDLVAHLTRRLIDRYFRRPSPTSRAPPRLFGLEGIKLTNQALSNAETSRRASKTSHDPSSVALGTAVVAQLTPVLLPLEFVYDYAQSREFSSSCRFEPNVMTRSIF